MEQHLASDPGAILAVIFGVLFGISEALDAIPQIRANSVWKSIRNVIYALVGKPIPEDPKL